MGRELATLITILRAIDHRLKIQAIGHSLGARVILTALPHLPPGSLSLAIFLAGAELRGVAQKSLDTPAGRHLSVLNVVSRENALFDYMLTWLLAPFCFAERALGHGLGTPCSTWVDLAIHHPTLRRGLSALGYTVPAASRWLCHWSVYLRPGLFPLYRDVVLGALPLAQLAALQPKQTKKTRMHNPVLRLLPFRLWHAS